MGYEEALGIFSSLKKAEKYIKKEIFDNAYNESGDDSSFKKHYKKFLTHGLCYTNL